MTFFHVEPYLWYSIKRFMIRERIVNLINHYHIYVTILYINITEIEVSNNKRIYEEFMNFSSMKKEDNLPS